MQNALRVRVLVHLDCLGTEMEGLSAGGEIGYLGGWGYNYPFGASTTLGLAINTDTLNIECLCGNVRDLGDH